MKRGRAIYLAAAGWLVLISAAASFGQITGCYSRGVQVTEREEASPKFGGKCSVITLSNGTLAIRLNRTAAGWIDRVKYQEGSAGETLSSDIYMMIRTNCGSMYEYHSAVQAVGFRMEERPASVACVVEQRWPMINIVKTIEFFDDPSYCRLRYDVAAEREFYCDSVGLYVVATREMDAFFYPDHGAVVSRRHARLRRQWFNFNRNDRQRWLAFQDYQSGYGLTLAGPNMLSWIEYPDLMGVAENPGGGYFLACFKKWRGQNIRKGDRTIMELFLFGFRGAAVEKSSTFYNTMIPY